MTGRPPRKPTDRPPDLPPELPWPPQLADMREFARRDRERQRRARGQPSSKRLPTAAELAREKAARLAAASASAFLSKEAQHGTVQRLVMQAQREVIAKYAAWDAKVAKETPPVVAPVLPVAAPKKTRGKSAAKKGKGAEVALRRKPGPVPKGDWCTILEKYLISRIRRGQRIPPTTELLNYIGKKVKGWAPSPSRVQKQTKKIIESYKH